MPASQNESVEFFTLRAREASAVIRGFVYQINTTIARWLNLAEDEVLELEAGEDIDTIRTHLQEGCDYKARVVSYERLLEQVKNTAAPVTLRSAYIREAIARCNEHLRANSHWKLSYRYVTTASITKERPYPAEFDGKPGLVVWEELRCRSFPEAIAPAARLAISRLLLEAPRPEGVAEAPWLQFKASLADNAAFERLLDSLEWSTDQPDTNELIREVNDTLLQRGLSSGSEEAEEHRRRLFAYTLDVICERDISKRRLVAADLQRVLGEPPSAHDQRLLSNIEHVLTELREQVAAHSVRLEVLESEHATLAANVDSLRNDLNTHISAPVAQLTAQTELLCLIPPPPLELRCGRSRLIAILSEQLLRHGILWLEAASGIGKTELALLLLENLGAPSVWLRLRGLKIQNFSSKLRTAVVQASVISPSSQNQGVLWYQEAFRNWREKTVLILEDIPAISNRDDLVEELTWLALASHSAKIRVICTSYDPPPMRLSDRLGGSRLAVHRVPPFDEVDIAELLKLHHAPTQWMQPRYLELLQAWTRGHPTLLNAAVKYLHSSNWDGTSINGLIAGEHAVSIESDAINRFVDHVTDDKTRELLYRLSLIARTFNDEDVRAVSEVSPEIDEVRRRLGALLGAWIQRETEGRYQVSLLLRNLGSSELRVSTRQAVHLHLANRILRQPTVVPEDIMFGIGHLCNGGQDDAAGRLLVWALFEAERVNDHTWGPLFLALWGDVPLPEGMALATRILIRTGQIRLAHQLNRPWQQLVVEFGDLLERATANEALALVLSFGFVGLLIDRTHLPMALRLYSKAVEHASEARLPGQERPVSSVLHIPLESFIWHLSTNVREPSQLNGWIDVLTSLTPSQRDRAVAHRAAYEATASGLPDALWMREAERGVAERSWGPVILALDELAHAAAAAGFALLKAGAARARLIIEAEYCGNLASALACGQEALLEAQGEPRARFLLQEAIARQHFYNGQAAAGQRWLLGALAESTDAYPVYRMYSLLSASQAFSANEPMIAIHYAEEAVSFTACTSALPRTEHAKALGELAIARWRQDGFKSGFPILSEAVRLLLNDNQRRDNRWKSIVVLFAKLTGCWEALAMRNELPKGIDGQTFPFPEPGWFTRHYPGDVLLRDYKDRLVRALSHPLARIAAELDDTREVLGWARRGRLAAREAGDGSLLVAVTDMAVPFLLLEDAYEEAIDWALEHGVVMSTGIQMGHQLPEEAFDIASVVRDRSAPGWREGEEYARRHILLGMAWRLCMLSMQDHGLAQVRAVELATLLRTVGRQSPVSDEWEMAATVLERSFGQRESPDKLVNWANGLNSREDTLRAISYLAASLDDRVSPEQAAAAQDAALSVSERGWKAMVSPLASRFLENFWTPARDARLYLLEAAIAIQRAYRAQRGERARAILKAVQEALTAGRVF